jgi:hypothetical protein
MFMELPGARTTDKLPESEPESERENADFARNKKVLQKRKTLFAGKRYPDS